MQSRRKVARTRKGRGVLVFPDVPPLVLPRFTPSSLLLSDSLDRVNQFSIIPLQCKRTAERVAEETGAKGLRRKREGGAHDDFLRMYSEGEGTRGLLYYYTWQSYL